MCCATKTELVKSLTPPLRTCYTLSTLNQVPEPQSLVLLATGIVRLLGYGWRKRGQEA
jgi:hypothetical protein